MQGRAGLYVEKLMTLDMNRYEASVYVSLLQQGEATALQLAEHSGVPRQRVYDVLDSLDEKGFCRRTGNERPRRHVVVAPERALPALLERRRRRQRAENRRHAQLIQELIVELQEVRGDENRPASMPEFTLEDVDKPIGGL